MSEKMGWFGARMPKAELADVLAELLPLAPQYGRPDWFTEIEQGPWVSVGIVGWAIGHAYAWAQSVSAHAAVTTVAFFVLEHTWSYAVFDRGVHVAGMQSLDQAVPVLVGDLERAAELLGVDAELFRAYCVGHPFADIDAESVDEDTSEYMYETEGELSERYRARPGDENAPWVDWVHTEFARRLGIEDAYAGDPFPIESAPPSGARWVEGPLLTVERDLCYAFDPAAFRAQQGVADRPDKK